MLGARQPERHGRHKALPAGQHATVVVGILPEQVQRFRDGRGGVVLERGGLHFPESIGGVAAPGSRRFLHTEPFRAPPRPAGRAAKMHSRLTGAARSGRYAAAAMPQTIGQPLRRKEDLRLLTGGRYSDGRQPAWPGLRLRAALAARPRPHPFDRHLRRAMPGVLAVLTGADVRAAGLKDIPHTPIHPSHRPTFC